MNQTIERGLPERFKFEDWVSSEEAAKIISGNSGHAVSPRYVRLLASMYKWPVKRLGAKFQVYSRSHVEGYRVKRKAVPAIA